MKRIAMILLFAALLAVSISAQELTYVYDNADLYSGADEIEISLAAESIYTESGLLTVVVTDYGIYDMLDELPYYSSGAEDMVLLAIDMSAREFEVYQYNATYGESAFRVSYSESENILDGILPDMANGNYASAALAFISMSHEYFTNTVTFDPDGVGGGYEYIDYPEEEVGVLDCLLIGIFAGAAIGGISVLCVFLSYKRKVHGDTYPLGQFADLKMVENRDTFITKNVIVTRIPDPPQGGGSHGGGGFRGGGGGARMGGRSF